ncbi:hypothetical protein LHYA1_G000377 [Lachnellula hyalina]|uniref:Phytanoyl-CoA dioxygenase n=1 Tax=Lachnellula hyalina TaxID=1316788 RepID=A0A8H8R8T0_9HELO|nr:uncharacterized protein LHYA1_G000377 [Lachnellula hyalina]TVY30725.1 hypothetical protein LHYA1_G000377 [Lachnellula hyalina]
MSQTVLLTDSAVIDSPSIQTSDWRNDLQRDGYYVVKGAIPPERATQYRQQSLDWLSSFGTALNINDPSTWTASNLPVHSKFNLFKHYAVSHERFMWEVRMEPGVLGAFAHLWGTDELLSSFDSLNVTLPNRIDKPRNESWEHIDQSPLRDGRCCVQGFVNLSRAGPEDGGLVVYPGSHNLVEEFFATQTEKRSWSENDFFPFSSQQLEWFKTRGCQPLKVCAEPGDLVLWDSRTIHYGGEPGPASREIRSVIYVAYAPASWAVPAALKIKTGIFERWGATSHWPHTNIRAIDLKAMLPNGERDPRDREEPLVKPILTDKLLKLAGVVSY